VRRLVSGDVVLHEVTVPEGLTLIRTVALLEAAGLEIQGSLEQETRRVGRIAAFDPQATDLEGYLFPDTYTFSRRVTARAVVDRLVARFREVADSLQAELGPPDRTVRAWVTLASLVERETGRDDERERVASVFLNRLDRNMLLQCDPTVLYALERAGEPHGESLADRLAFDDPYNTYLHAGLPPGPIASPGEAALRASLHPARHDELYFVADGDGGHRFSRTLREHNRAVRDLRRRTMAGPGR
ncbi:MAG: endolytic transglycosylase MltG, partial [Acidobacteriota bacterium]